MPKKPAKKKRAGRRGLRVSMHPLTAEQALRAVLSIKPEDAKLAVERSKGRKEEEA